MTKKIQTCKLILVALTNLTLLGCSGAQQDNKSQKTLEKNSMNKSYVVASPYRGQLLRNGEPVTNQKIINELRWNGRDKDPMLREIVTDDQGFFEVAEYLVELDLGMFEEFTGTSRVYIEGEESIGFQGMPDYFMSISRGDFESGEEFGEPPENMICETTTELGGFDLKTGIGSTKCIWDNMYKSELFK